MGEMFDVVKIVNLSKTANLLNSSIPEKWKLWGKIEFQIVSYNIRATHANLANFELKDEVFGFGFGSNSPFKGFYFQTMQAYFIWMKGKYLVFCHENLILKFKIKKPKCCDLVEPRSRITTFSQRQCRDDF